MFRTLTIVAIAGLAVAAVSIAGVCALAGPDFAAHGWRLGMGMGPSGGFDWRSDGPPATREIRWSAGHELDFAGDGDVHYRQGAEHKLLVTGPAGALSHIHMENGRLSDDLGVLPDDLTIEVTAPDIDTFKVLGDGDLKIDGFDRDRLDIEVDGSGDVTSSGGRAREVDIDLRGSGDADVGAVRSEQARVRIFGSGDAAIAPTRSADIDIVGSGDVTLTSNPPQVKANIAGSGSVVRAGPTPAPSPTPPAARPARASRRLGGGTVEQDERRSLVVVHTKRPPEG
jgi:hypothetical protein